MNNIHLFNFICLLSILSNEINGSAIGKRSRNINRKNSRINVVNSDEPSDSKIQTFSYSIDLENSFTNRVETRYPDGKVVGSYYISHPDTTVRRVSYVADETGFHVKVMSNENGVKPVNTADAIFEYYDEKNLGFGIEEDFQSSRRGKGLNEKDLSLGSPNKDDPKDYE